MGSILSKAPKDYEHILAELEDKIYLTEINISESHIRQRKITALLTMYSTIVYLFWLLSFFLFVWPMSSLHQDGLGGMSMKLLPIPAAPLCIYGIRWMVEAYYRRSITHQCEHLESLKKQQRQKIEEMKQKMNYYTAKTLIERYDESAAPDTKGLTKRHSRSDFVPMAAGEIKNNAEAEEIQSGPATAEYSDKPRLSMAPNDYPPEVFNSQRPLYRKDISAAVYANPHPLPQSRTWIDRVLDLIVGEETSPSTKYALVCEKCFHHNGLALEEELDNLKYTCPHCGHLNLKRKTGQLTTESLIGQSNEIT